MFRKETEVMDTKVDTLVMASGRIVSEETITPEQALVYIDSMPGNRPIRQNEVNRIADAIRSGGYHSTTTPLHFDTQGRLRNGEHRMWAVVNANQAATFLVVRNVTEDELHQIDIGAPRTPADMLTMDKGVSRSRSKLLAAALVTLLQYERGEDPTRNYGKASNQEMLAFYDLHPKMLDSVEYISTQPGVKRLAPPRLITFCHYIICRANPLLGPQFFDSLAKGIYQLGDKDAVYHLRERLTLAKESDSRLNKLELIEVVALTLKAWNKWVKGTPTHLLKWARNDVRVGGEWVRKGEPFPHPIAR
mgnify:CR=1 FL=1